MEPLEMVAGPVEVVGFDVVEQLAEVARLSQHSAMERAREEKPMEPKEISS